jgi:hypothetical protein
VVTGPRESWEQYAPEASGGTELAGLVTCAPPALRSGAAMRRAACTGFAGRRLTAVLLALDS